jgi:hypothetical protein
MGTPAPASRRSRRRLAAMATGCCLAAGVLAASGVPALASTPARAASVRAASARAAPFVSFSSFLKATAGARYGSFAAANRSDVVRSAQTFGRMRSYILATYRGVKVRHSFVLDGSYFDCVTVRSQPAVRQRGIRKIATPPRARTLGRRTGPPAARTPASPLSLGRKDRYGHAVSCPAATIPMRRISLAQVTRFPTLSAFFAKGPGGAKAARALIRPTRLLDTAHRYAVMYQGASNYGGNSFLNLWDPEGDFTLSQQWYVGGPGTVEGGWIHYPDAWGYNSVLFTYWTSDNYQDGCYDLDCGAFVQTNSSIPLGASFTAYSSIGGPQYGFSMQWQYYQGNWWMFYQGTAVGYYPGGIYGSGPLATGNASVVEYGGEAVPFGDDAWPQMGSGQFASGGWAQAAFQSQVFYLAQGGPATWAQDLGGIAETPSCYTLGDTEQGSYQGDPIYFGGPGGNC